MTQWDLASKAGVSEKTIRRYENGQIRRPQREALERVALALGEDADFFDIWLTSRPKNWHRRKVTINS